MDQILLPFLVAGLAEMGDATQQLTRLLSRRFARRGAVIAGVALAAFVNAALAAAAGALIRPLLPFRAISLLLGLALVAIAIGNLLRAKAKDTARDWRLGAFATSAIAFLILSFGDKSQLAIAAFSARGGAPVSVALASAAGIVAANLPAALAEDDLAAVLPMRAIRLAIGALFLAVGLWVALDAVRLI